MKRHPFKRMLACLLALLLLPVPPVLAEEAGTELTITCRDIFREEEEKAVTVLETKDGYYITFDDAIYMVGLVYAGGDYFAPYAHVSLRPNTNDLAQITHNGETWYALEQLMTELDTSILAADGELYYNSLIINQDRLMEETQRIMDNGGYEADLLSDLLLSDVLAGFALAYDILRNQRFDVVKGYEDDLADLLLEMLKHHGDNEYLLRVLSEGTELAEKTYDCLLNAQLTYEQFFPDQNEALTGVEYLLFGGEGSGSLREISEALDDHGINISEILSNITFIQESKRVQLIYANALARMLEAPEIKNENQIVVQQGERILRLYEDHLTDNRGQLAAEGILMTVEDIVSNLKENLLDVRPPLAKTVSYMLELGDACTLQTIKKNDCVRNIAICAQLQDLFRDVYQGTETETPDAQAALTARDAAMLYLQSAWVSYDTGSFDDDIAGAIKRVQAQIDDELITLAGFPDGMFCAEPNEPLPVGILGFHSELEAPTGNEGLYHKLYLQFLRDGAYIGYVDNGTLQQALAEGTGAGAFYFHDVDRDGADDLIVWSGCSGADGEVQLFTGAGDAVTYLGSVPCDGSGIGIYGSDRMTGLILSEYDGTGELLSSYDVLNGKLAARQRPKQVSLDGWEPLEAYGQLPLGSTAWDTWGDAFEFTAMDGLFLMTAPGSWGDGFVVKDDERGFTVYERRSYEAGFGGELFHVTMSEYIREEDIDEPYYQVLGCWAEGFLLVAGFPICAQFDLNNARQRESWQAMEADVPGVLASLRMTR